MKRMIAVHRHLEAMKGEDAMKELVEEIAGQIRHYKYFAEKRAPTPSDRIKASFDLAEDFITLILSAVRDGRLEQELGVIAKGNVAVVAIHGDLTWLIDDKNLDSIMEKCLGQMITISIEKPREGTGKEE